MTIEKDVNELFEEGKYVTVQDARTEMREMYGEKAFPDRETYGGDIPTDQFKWYKMIYEKIHETKKKKNPLIKNIITTVGTVLFACFAAKVLRYSLIVDKNTIGALGSGFATLVFARIAYKSMKKIPDNYAQMKLDREYLESLEKNKIYQSIEDVL